MPRAKAEIQHRALLEWCRDNRVLRIRVNGLEAEFLQSGQTAPEPRKELTPEEARAEHERILMHSTDD